MFSLSNMKAAAPNRLSRLAGPRNHVVRYTGTEQADSSSKRPFINNLTCVWSAIERHAISERRLVPRQRVSFTVHRMAKRIRRYKHLGRSRCTCVRIVPMFSVLWGVFILQPPIHHASCPRARGRL